MTENILEFSPEQWKEFAQIYENKKNHFVKKFFKNGHLQKVRVFISKNDCSCK